MSQSVIPKQGPTPAQQSQKHYHHGQTPAAWAGSLTATAGFLVGGIGFAIEPLSPVFWVGVALVVLAVILTVVMRQMGYGAG